MTTKEDVLKAVRLGAIQGLVGLDELTDVYRKALGQPAVPKTQRITLVELLYFLGGAVVFIGISVLLGQHWRELSFLTKELATLGVGIAAYTTGIFLSREDKYVMAGQAFFLISALVLPVGLGLLFDHAGWDTGRAGTQALISGVLLAFFLGSYALFRTNVFLLFAVLYGTWFFHSLTGFLLSDGRPEWRAWKLHEYRALVAGTVYMILGYAFSQDERRALTGFLYGFGVLMFLGAAFCLIGWKPNQNIFWELLFPIVTFGILFLSVYVKSSSFLTFGSIFLIFYIGKITVDYFKDSLGWPLSLVLIGFALMGTGYAAFTLNKKYIRLE